MEAWSRGGMAPFRLTQTVLSGHDCFEQYPFAFNRILELMRSYYEEGTARITRLNPIRFMYEESPHYEMGYITGEIIERYRKILEYTQKAFKFQYLSLFEIMKSVEYTQKMYFELYHLVRMIHETPRKYRNETEFMHFEKIAGPRLLEASGVDGKGTQSQGSKSEKTSYDMLAIQKSMIQRQRYQDRQKIRQKEKFKKIREAFLLKGIKTNVNKPYNSKWPLDYGWEVEFDW